MTKKISDYSYNRYSQFGEDGIINKIFDTIGTSSKVCIEFGAWDGFHLSNTANLWTNGWKGILIEANPQKFASLIARVKPYDCHCINAMVGYTGSNTLENILKYKNISAEIDFLSIDIDGDDYWVLKSLKDIHPRLIACEYNPTIPFYLNLIPSPSNYFGCSAFSLIELAKSKGYALVAMTETNCFFVREQDSQKFQGYDLQLESIAPRQHLTYFMTGYNGRYILSRKPTYGCSWPSQQKFKGQYYALPFAWGMINILSSLSLKKNYEIIAEKLRGIPRPQQVKKWFAANGDKTLRINYDLNKNSIVFDVGGYEGNWASDIFNKYGCTIHCFEPVKKFADKIKNRFSPNPKIIVYNVGLSNTNQKANISHSADGSSIFRGTGSEEITLVNVIDFLDKNKITKVDLMKINIEGGEYDLLEYLIQQNSVTRFQNLQIQFHDFMPRARERMKNIQKNLEKTHALTYQFEFVWENWKLKT